MAGKDSKTGTITVTQIGSPIRRPGDQRATLVGAAKGTDGEPPRALSSCVSHRELA